jgi:hypothetical protein
MRYALESRHHGPDEEFATPNRTVIAVSRSIKGNAQYALLECSPLRQDARDMSTVMLNGVRYVRAQTGRVTRRCVLGV